MGLLWWNGVAFWYLNDSTCQILVLDLIRKMAGGDIDRNPNIFVVFQCFVQFEKYKFSDAVKM